MDLVHTLCTLSSNPNVGRYFGVPELRAKLRVGLQQKALVRRWATLVGDLPRWWRAMLRLSVYLAVVHDVEHDQRAILALTKRVDETIDWLFESWLDAGVLEGSVLAMKQIRETQAAGDPRLTPLPFRAGELRTYTVVGTPFATAPEVLLGHGWARASDWWSYGVLLFEMLAVRRARARLGSRPNNPRHAQIFRRPI